MNDTLMNGQQETVYRYAAGNILDDLHARKAIDTPLQAYLLSHPLYKYCRAEVKESDKDMLKETACSQTAAIPVRRFALRLLGRFKDDPDVKMFFLDLWRQSSAYEVKVELLWSLLSYKDLSEELYADISRSFDAAEWDKWLPLVVEKLEGDEEEKARVKDLMKKFFNLPVR